MKILQGPCLTTHKIKKELSICQSLLCLDLVSFPVLSQIKPQAPIYSTKISLIDGLYLKFYYTFTIMIFHIGAIKTKPSY